MGAGRECTYSVARRGIGSIRGHWGSSRGCWASEGGGGGRGVLGLAGSVGTQARKGISGIKGHWGLLGVLGSHQGM